MPPYASLSLTNSCPRRPTGATSFTPAFRSPESLLSGYRLSFELDMWALGVTMYMWIYGELPFGGAAPFMVYENIRRGEVRLPEHTQVSDELASLLLALLSKDPSQRLSIADAIRHPWVTGAGAAPLAAISHPSRMSGHGAVDDAFEVSSEENDVDTEEGAGERMEDDVGVATRGRLEAPLQPMSATSRFQPQRRPPPPRQCSSSVRHTPASNAGHARPFDLSLMSVPELSSGGRGRFSGRAIDEEDRDVEMAEGEEPAAGPLSAMQAEPSHQRTGRRRRRGEAAGFKPHKLRLQGLTQEELSEAISRTTGGTQVMEAIGSVFEEVRYGPREQIIAVGDPMEHVYLITQVRAGGGEGTAWVMVKVGGSGRWHACLISQVWERRSKEALVKFDVHHNIRLSAALQTCKAKVH